eukprot:UN10361
MIYNLEKFHKHLINPKSKIFNFQNFQFLEKKLLGDE